MKSTASVSEHAKQGTEGSLRQESLVDTVILRVRKGNMTSVCILYTFFIISGSSENDRNVH